MNKPPVNLKFLYTEKVDTYAEELSEGVWEEVRRLNRFPVTWERRRGDCWEEVRYSAYLEETYNRGEVK